MLCRRAGSRSSIHDANTTAFRFRCCPRQSSILQMYSPRTTDLHTIKTSGYNNGNERPHRRSRIDRAVVFARRYQCTPHLACCMVHWPTRVCPLPSSPNGISIASSVFTARRYNSAVYGVVRPYTVRLSVRLSQAEMDESSWFLARGLKTTKIMATDKVIQQPYCCTSVAYLQKYGLQQKPGVAIFLPTPTCIALQCGVHVYAILLGTHNHGQQTSTTFRKLSSFELRKSIACSHGR